MVLDRRDSVVGRVSCVVAVDGWRRWVEEVCVLWWIAGCKDVVIVVSGHGFWGWGAGWEESR